MKHTRAGAPFAVLLALTPLWSSPALAQSEPGLRGTFSFGQTIEATDNRDFTSAPTESDILARTTLGFSLNSETRTQTFSLSLGTVFEGGLDGDTDFEFIRDTARVNYMREGASARFSLGAFYDDSELDDLEIDLSGEDPDVDPDLLVVDAGSLERLGMTARLETGVGTPFGFSLTGRVTDTNYVDTVDPDLTDSDFYSLDSVARFRISPTLTARALFGLSRRSDDDADATERDRSYVGFGLSGDVNRSLSFSSDITFDKVETTAATTTTEDGVGLNLNVSQDRSNGTLGASLSSRIGESGRITQARVSRNLDLPGSALGFSLGLIDPEDDGIRPVASLNFSRELAQGQISAALSQTPVSNDGDTVLTTSFRMNFAQDINDVSGWAAGLSYSEANTLGTEDDSSRTSASLSYRRALTEDWGLRAGYTYRLRTEYDAPDRKENAVFLSIERDVTFGF